MSINRIDFQGAFLNTGEQNNIKSADNSRVQGEQAAFQTQFNKEKNEEANAVAETSEMFKQQSKFDAREKSKNEYERRKGGRKGEREKNKKNKDDQTSDGDIQRISGNNRIVRQIHNFDIKA